MEYYKLRYGTSGMPKIITKEDYEDLSMGDQYFYSKATKKSCGAIEEDKEKETRDSIIASAYEKAYEDYADSDFGYYCD